MTGSSKREAAFFDIEDKPRGKKGGSAEKRGASTTTGKSSAAKKTVAATRSLSKKPVSAKQTKTSAASRAKTSVVKNPEGGTAQAVKTTKKRAASAEKHVPAFAKNTASSAKKSVSAGKNAFANVQENPLSRRKSAAAAQSVPRQRKAAAPKPSEFSGDVRRRSPLDGMSVVLLTLIAAMLALGIWRFGEYSNFRAMKTAVAAQTFYGGTVVDGVDVAGMTLAEANAYWENNVESAYRDAAVALDDGTRVTAGQMGYSSDYAQVLSNAWNAGRSGTLEERYARIAQSSVSPSAYGVSRSMYDDAVVRSFAAQLADRIDTGAQPAAISSFNLKTYEFEFSEGAAGRRLDQDKLVASIESALNAGGGNVALPVETIQPSQSRSQIESQYGLICYAITNASSSSKNRLSNIRLALSIINGTCLEPGEQFSFNEVVGRRTTARGFKLAAAYSRGEVIEDVGGGICQVSTTLFNAAVKADMRIDERNSHSMTVSYVDPGKDAAVDWGNKDLKFTNTSPDKVYICCYLTDDKRIRFGIFGKLPENGQTITVESKKTGDVDYETEYQINFTMASGQQNLVQKGKKGCTAVTWKVYHDADGNEIARSELYRSRYQATKEIIEVGP